MNQRLSSIHRHSVRGQSDSSWSALVPLAYLPCKSQLMSTASSSNSHVHIPLACDVPKPFRALSHVLGTSTASLLIQHFLSNMLQYSVVRVLSHPSALLAS